GELNDPKAEARYLAEKTLEYVALARDRLRRKADSVPDLNRGEGPKKAHLPTRNNAELVRVSATEEVCQEEPEKPIDLNRDVLPPGLVYVLPTLVAQLRHPNVRVRIAAADALEPIGPLASSYVPQIVPALSDPDLFVRWASARLLSRIGAVDTNLTVPPLAKL